MSKIPLACSEIWGGRREVDQDVILPGVRASVFSRPSFGDAEGGDIQYLGSCAMGRLAKVVLADASGHGASAGRIADLVERCLRHSINENRNDRFLSLLNGDLARDTEAGHFATMISVIINAADGQLRFASAAQPFMAQYQTSAGRWDLLDARAEGSLPLGIVDKVSYFESDRRLDPGDLIVLFSDGVIEMGVLEQREVGFDGLMAWLAEGPTAGARAVKDHLVRKMTEFSGRPLFEDDVTLVVLEFTGSA
ncbi:MAG: SpoIIE family protein phosphatase [Anaerolineaceae bacterium]|nr:SpoIIE family protein phosphatase [Anaerolineaceae bacterium]